MKKVLVTGGVGFICSNLIKRLFMEGGGKGVLIINFDNMNVLVSKEKHPCQRFLSRCHRKAYQQEPPPIADPKQRKQTEALHILN